MVTGFEVSLWISGGSARTVVITKTCQPAFV